MELKEAILGYMTVLDVERIQNGLLGAERDIGLQSILGCLPAIEEGLYRKGDATSISLMETIRERERINGRIHDITNSELLTSTEACAQKVFDYYVEQYR
jgi:hypothetical protein